VNLWIFLPFYHYRSSFCNLSVTANIIAVKVWALALSNVGRFIIFRSVIIFGDILTEVYGYKSRKVSVGFLCNLFLLSLPVRQLLPPVPVGPGRCLCHDSRYTADCSARLFRLLIGEFANSFVLAKMKYLPKGAGCGPGLSVQLLSPGFGYWHFIVGAMFGRFSLPVDDSMAWPPSNYRSGFTAHLYHRQLFEEKRICWHLWLSD